MCYRGDERVLIRLMLRSKENDIRHSMGVLGGLDLHRGVGGMNGSALDMHEVSRNSRTM
jgi:hypothetical protein